MDSTSTYLAYALVASAILFTGTTLYAFSKGYHQKIPEQTKKKKIPSRSPLTRIYHNESSTIIQSRRTEIIREETSTTSKDNNYRGYKTNEDGKRTTYFHRELSVEDRRLTGNCTPKLISPSNSSSSSPRSESLWNSAGLWEERDQTQWARSHLKSTLSSQFIRIPHNQGEISVSEVEILDGDASVVLSRGKRKFIYDFSIDIYWTAKLKTAGTIYTLTGKFAVNDVTSDCLYDIKSSIPDYNASSPEKTRRIIDEYILSSNKGIKKEIIDCLNK